MNVKGDVHAVGLGLPGLVARGELEAELGRDPGAAMLSALPIGVFATTAQGSPFCSNPAGVGIVGRHAGDLSFSSARGHGTTFHIHLSGHTDA